MGIAFQTMVQFTTDNYPHDEDPLARRIIDWVEKNPPEIPAVDGRLYPTGHHVTSDLSHNSYDSRHLLYMEHSGHHRRHLVVDG
jgi:hypothetical protein